MWTQGLDCMKLKAPWSVKIPSRDYPVVRTPQVPSLVRELRFPHVSQPKKNLSKSYSLIKFFLNLNLHDIT